MSENLSIDEIIRRAEEIKKEAQAHLEAAEKSLDEQAKVALDEVVVDEKKVVEKIADVYKRIEEDDEEEDVKEYVPPKKKPSVFVQAQRLKEEEEDDVKIADEISPVPEKTVPVSLLHKEKTNVIGDLGKTRPAPNIKSAPADEKTRPAPFVSSSTVDEKSDLQEIPTIVAREHIYDVFDGGNADAQDYYENIGVQMTFEGFDDEVESVPKIDEELAEELLMKKREEKVGKFRLFGPDETDKELGNDKEFNEDYIDEDEKLSFFNDLVTKKATVGRRMTLSVLPAALLLLMALFKDSAYFPSALSSHTAYFVTALVLYIAVLGINFNVLVHGFNVKKSLNYDFSIALTSVLIAAHTAFLLFNRNLWIDNGVLLAPCGAFALLMSQYGKRRMMARIVDNFEFITEPNQKYTVENIANSVDAEIISRGLIEDEPLIKTSVKTDFPTNFLEISCKNEPANRISKLIFGVAVLLSFILLIVIGILNNFNTAVNCSLCALSIALPCCALFLSNTALCDISAGLQSYGARVCGYEGAAMAHGANAMVMEAADLFGRNSCEMHGIKTFGGAKVDDAIIQAAAVMIQTKSPLARVFDSVIIGKQSILPKVDGVTYEDRMGTSAWIYNRKVLVGNRDLLVHHGVSVPKESFEKKYTAKGRKALYLAVGGDIRAMFVVSYSADPALKRELRKLEKSGITIIVKSSDPYINEKSIARLFSLPEGFVRVMNYSAARVYDKYSNMHVEKSPAYIVHCGTALGFVSAMRSAEILISIRSILRFLSCFGCAIGFAVVALLSVLEAYQSITALNIIIFQLAWNLFVMIILKLRGLGL